VQANLAVGIRLTWQLAKCTRIARDFAHSLTPTRGVFRHAVSRFALEVPGAGSPPQTDPRVALETRRTYERSVGVHAVLRLVRTVGIGLTAR
jgi:hypothetical protein